MGVIEIVFDGPTSHESGRFIEVERDGKSFSFGEWRQRSDGYWILEIPDHAAALAEKDAQIARFHEACNRYWDAGHIPEKMRAAIEEGAPGAISWLEEIKREAVREALQRLDRLLMELRDADSQFDGGYERLRTETWDAASSVITAALTEGEP